MEAKILNVDRENKTVELTGGMLSFTQVLHLAYEIYEQGDKFKPGSTECEFVKCLRGAEMLLSPDGSVRVILDGTASPS